MTDRKLKFGVAGLGRAFQLMLPTLAAHAKVEVVAAADPRQEARARFAADFSAKTFATVDELCADPSIDVVYVATPHQFHAAHVAAAARHGKHVLVEKPMALNLADCRAMIEATRRAAVQMVIGHSHSFDAPVSRARDVIVSGSVGRLRMISALNFTDFLYRPRRPEELSTESGGGVLYNQAPHHVEMVRLLGGGKIKSVRALTGAWDERRPTEGAYSALLTFEDGAFATITYSGYAHFDSDELEAWIAESGHSKDPNKYGETRRQLRSAAADEEVALKHARNYGGSESASAALPAGARFHQHFGFLIASCERADLRPTATGVVIYDDFARRFDAVPVPKVPRTEVIDELYDAIVHGRPPLHGGEWSLATMEVCLAMLQSAREGREMLLQHQVGARP
jgi:phthalate 4,5-cis-dihydrodiol dehydrogenase